MAAEASTPDPDPTLMEQMLDRQRDHWRRGERVPVEKLLENHPTLADDRERLLDLICNEVDLRAAHGETPRLDEYRGRFPALSDDLGRRFAALQPSSKTLESRDAPSDRTAAGESALSDGIPIPPPTTLPPPDIEGYEVLGLLGKGGMGIVYQARQTAAGRVVALKMILGGFADEETRARFRTEGRAVAALQHPNVVQVFEVGEHRGAPYFSLEFCAGGGLDRKLNGTPLPAAEAARLVETLARAVQHAHDKGVVHRDLKPANVLLTADGTPKVTDFGLAKRVDEVGHTQTGAVLGSPPYMAPEQAAGQSREIGPATDVYALGAILYECLTGRPPFRAATLLDTLVQVRNDDPVPPRQLQSKTPRDLETVCLKCLQKDPKKRYASAAALAEDLRRYRAGEPVAARPAGRPERTWRWCRRNPKDAALIAAGLLAVVLGVFAYLWIAGARQAAEQDRLGRQATATTAAERNLAEAELLWEQAKAAPVGDLVPWEKALAAAGRAKEGIDANAVGEATRRRVEQTWVALSAAKEEAETRAAAAARDERMKAALEKLAFSQMELTTVQGQGQILGVRLLRPDAEYERVFRTDYGIDLSRPEQAEARIRDSAIKPQLVAALEAWIPLRTDERKRHELADLADRLSEPDDFRRELRKALAEKDLVRLRELTKRDLSALPPRFLFDLTLPLIHGRAYEEAIALLRPAQQRYPADFGINFQLGYCLSNLQPPRPEEATRFYTAAVAIQPDDVMAHNNLGCALEAQGKGNEAVAEYRTALRLNPKYAYSHHNLGLALVARGKLDEAVAEFRTAVQLDGSYAVAHHGLGFALAGQGKLDEAVAEYRAAIKLDPSLTDVHYNLGVALQGQGKPGEAAGEFRAAIGLAPKYSKAHVNLGVALASQGKSEEAAGEFRAAMQLAPDWSLPHYSLGVLRNEQGKVEEAIAEFRTALKIQPDYADARANLGSALRLNGEFADALTEFKKCLELYPPADPHRGRATQEAHRTEHFIQLEDKLTAVLKGEVKPADAGEAVQLAWICLLKKKPAAAARLYADGFASASSVAQNGKVGQGVAPARAAALAGCGQGKDAADLTEPQRARWRKQALDWLRAELDAWAKQAGSDKPEDRLAAARQLHNWQCHVDFAGVRDEAELKKLPEDEQAAWRKLWADVAALVERAENR